MTEMDEAQASPASDSANGSEPSEGMVRLTPGESRLAAALEAILFSSNRPLRIRELQAAAEASRQEVDDGLGRLAENLLGHGIMLQRHRDHVQLVTRPEMAGPVRRALHPEVVGKLSPAAYETLAIIAYEQPVTRSRVEEVRGVSCESVLANLELRALVTEVGRASTPGQPKLYGTTMRFLQLVGVASVEELPRVTENQEQKQFQLSD